MTAPTTPDAAPVLRRRVRPWTARPAGFFPPHFAEHGSAWVLAQAIKHDFRKVYLVGGWDAAHTPSREWFMAASADGWDVRYTPEPRSAKCTRDGRTVDVHMSSAWFGKASTPSQVWDAYAWLERLIRSHFDTGAVLMGTPARTGQDLLERSLPTYKEIGRERAYEYPAIPAEVADILRHNVGQGRMEFPALPETPRESDRLYLLDARWMYASCVRNLPVGPVTHDDLPDFEPYRNGWYKVAFRVPADWRHIGLLPWWDREAQKAVWPNEPGHLYSHTWASEPEVRLAREQGWDVRIIERILFAPTSQPGSDPARAWSEKLIALRAGLEKHAHAGPPDELRPLLSAAIRELLIQPIGGWYRTGRKQLHVTPHAQRDSIPASALDIVPVYTWDARRRMSAEPVRWEWYSEEPLSAMQLAYSRPEWAAMVWGRARAKLNAAALKVDPAQLVALRSDALAVTAYDPAAWPDNLKVGTFRLKPPYFEWDAPRPLPASEPNEQKRTALWKALVSEDGDDGE